MRIAFYTPPLGTEPCLGDRDRFIRTILARMMERHPGPAYVHVEEGRGSPEPPFASLERVVTGIGGPLATYRRYHFRLPALLRKLGASVVLSLTGALPLRGGVPGCLVAAGGNPEDPAFSRFLPLARVVCTFSGAEAAQLAARQPAGGIPAIALPPWAPAEFRPLGWEAREKVKEAHTEGREYLICLDSLADEAALVNLLKGFSLLKKRLRSSMVLVLAGHHRIPEAKTDSLLSTYHFRGDVRRVRAASDALRASLVGGAYALVAASAGSGFSSPVLEALASRVPVVAAREAALEETASEAALYFGPGDPADLGERLCDIYKYENLRARLIKAADERAARYSGDRTADALWEAVVQAAEAVK